MSRSRAASPCLVGSWFAPVKISERLSTIELIDGDGRKTALKGRGTKTGGYWAAQPLPEGDGNGTVLMIGEGVEPC